MRAQQAVVDAVQQPLGTVTAAYGEDGLHLGVAEHVVQVVEALLVGAAQVAGALAHIAPHLRTQPEVFDGADSQRQPIGVGNVGSGRDQAHRIAFSQRLRLHQNRWSLRFHRRPRGSRYTQTCQKFSASGHGSEHTTGKIGVVA